MGAPVRVSLHRRDTWKETRPHLNKCHFWVLDYEKFFQLFLTFQISINKQILVLQLERANKLSFLKIYVRGNSIVILYVFFF